MNLKVCFFLKTNNPSVVNFVDFYKTDIQILKDIGFEVIVTTSIKNIPTDVDFYFIWWWTYAIFPVLISKLRKRPTIITGTFNLAPKHDGKSFFSRPYYEKMIIKKSARLADANIVVSKYEYDKFKEYITDKVFYSPHVFSNEKYSEIKFSQRKNYVFTLASLEIHSIRRKCILQIIESASILRSKNVEIKFFIAGIGGPHREIVENLIDNLGLKDIIILLGQITEEEKLQRMHECKIYLQPTQYEGFGMAIAEALLCKTPVITSEVGAVPEVTNGNCYYVNGKKPEKIANAIEHILNDYQKFLNKTLMGRRYVIKNFYYERRLNEIRKIISNIGIKI